MRMVNPLTGQAYVEKRRRRFNEPNQPRELTFSCFRRIPFLECERTREWFRDALQATRAKFAFQVWAYVLMPEHVHLLVYPGGVARSARPYRRRCRLAIGRACGPGRFWRIKTV